MGSARACLLTVALLALLIASPQVRAASITCDIASNVGLWYVGTLRGGSGTGTVATIAVGTVNTLYVVTQSEVIYLETSKWVDNSFTLTEFARTSLTTQALVSTSPCGPGNHGNYTYRSNNACATITLVLISDTCADRAANFNAFTMTLTTTKPPFPEYADKCAIATGDLFRSNASSVQSSVMFLQSSIMQMNSTTGDVFYFTGVVAAGARSITVRDVYVPNSNSFAGQCNNTVRGVYDMIWLPDCTGFTFSLTTDPGDSCVRRLTQLDQLLVKRNYTAPWVKKKRASVDFAGAWSRERLIGVLVVLIVALVLMVLMCFMLTASKTQSTSRLDRRSRSRHRKRAKAAASAQPPPPPAAGPSGPNAV